MYVAEILTFTKKQEGLTIVERKIMRMILGLRKLKQDTEVELITNSYQRYTTI